MHRKCLGDSSKTHSGFPSIETVKTGKLELMHLK